MMSDVIPSGNTDELKRDAVALQDAPFSEKVTREQIITRCAYYGMDEVSPMMLEWLYKLCNEPIKFPPLPPPKYPRFDVDEEFMSIFQPLYPRYRF